MGDREGGTGNGERRAANSQGSAPPSPITHHPSPTDWLLLIYSVPSQPSRLRAAVWRDLKKAGAVYLRDGVAVLPARPETTATFREIAARIVESGGEGTLVEGARLPAERAA